MRIYLAWVLAKRHQGVWIIPSSHLGAHYLVHNLLILHYLSLFSLIFVEPQWWEAGFTGPTNHPVLVFLGHVSLHPPDLIFFFNYWFFVPVRVNKQVSFLIILGIYCFYLEGLPRVPALSPKPKFMFSKGSVTANSEKGLTGLSGNCEVAFVWGASRSSSDSRTPGSSFLPGCPRTVTFPPCCAC